MVIVPPGCSVSFTGRLVADPGGDRAARIKWARADERRHVLCNVAQEQKGVPPVLPIDRLSFVAFAMPHKYSAAKAKKKAQSSRPNKVRSTIVALLERSPLCAREITTAVPSERDRGEALDFLRAVADETAVPANDQADGHFTG